MQRKELVYVVHLEILRILVCPSKLQLGSLLQNFTYKVPGV